MFRYPDVNPGVLNPREVYEVKILLAYFLYRIDRACTPSQLLEIFTGDGITDYFLYTEALKEMLDSGTIVSEEIDGAKHYLLSEKGSAGAESFKRLVPKSVRDRILSSGMRLFARLKTEQCLMVDIAEADGSFYVNCGVRDNDIQLMSLNLYAPDREQAEHIRRRIRANPSEIYGRILDYVLCAEEEYSDPFDS